MRFLRVGAAALDQTPLDWPGNARRIGEAIERARGEGVGLLLCPELAIPGYGCDDFYQSPGVQAESLRRLASLRHASRGMVVAVGLPLVYRKALFNGVGVLADGELLGFAAKRYLAGDGLYYEPRWFKPWPAREVATLELPDEIAEAFGRATVPLGDLVFRTDDVAFGFEICEEAWVSQRPGSSLASRGVDLVLNPSASHFAFDKQVTRRRFVLEGSRAFGVAYVFANLLGNAAGRMLFDGGAMIAASGKMLAEGPRFRFSEIELTCATIDLDDIRMRQVRVASFVPEVSRRLEGEVSGPERLRLPEPDGDAQPCGFEAEADRYEGATGREESFARAVALGLFDYLRKSRARGFVVSLSGGADSAAVACLSALAVRFAVADLGIDGVREMLPAIDLADCTDADQIVHKLLLCVYQSTRNSSTTTLEAARAVAEGVGAEFLELDVDALVEGYVERVAEAVGRPLDWQRDDLALQNIQARVRSPGVWMLANLRGALLLATSNRSEAAVGYATMDGDTSGGLSPIAGIDKAFLRRWLRWMETTGPSETGPLPALAAVNALPPTAELRPRSADQTDEADLMPYDLLDAVERAAIGAKRMPSEVFRALRGQYPPEDHHQLATWIERFFRLWSRNQWKRERYAPSFHVDDENLDPKTWCRFPILSGGFETEIAAMWELVEGGGIP